MFKSLPLQRHRDGLEMHVVLVLVPLAAPGPAGGLEFFDDHLLVVQEAQRLQSVEGAAYQGDRVDQRLLVLDRLLLDGICGIGCEGRLSRGELGLLLGDPGIAEAALERRDLAALESILQAQ